MGADEDSKTKTISQNADDRPGNSDGDNREVTLRIVKHARLMQLLERPQEVWRLFIFMVCLLAVLLTGLTIMLSVVKKFYPYNAITTSLYGSTTLRSEDKEVTYWLFNTAQLWANSGIEVKEGDVLTIRASGAAHRAIHHLVNEADKNLYSTGWFSTDGAGKNEGESYKKYRFREKYRIAPYENDGVLLMQIIPSNEVSGEQITDYYDGRHEKSKDRIYVIGRERQNLVARTDGMLFFTINDIALTDRIIDEMYADMVKVINDSIKSAGLNPSMKITDSELERWLRSDNPDKTRRSIGAKLKQDTGGIYRRIVKNTFEVEGYSDSDKDNPLYNELLYYRHTGFDDAWFVDNLGSFLIVVERKHP